MRYLFQVTALFFLLQTTIAEGALIKPAPVEAPKAVTYDFSGGRFGDNLISYLHGKWVAHVLNLTFLYRPFEFSDKLEMHLNIASIGTTSFTVKYSIYKKDQSLAGTAQTVHVTLDGKTRKKIPIPETFKEILEKHLVIDN